MIQIKAFYISGELLAIYLPIYHHTDWYIDQKSANKQTGTQLYAKFYSKRKNVNKYLNQAKNMCWQVFVGMYLY